MTKDSGNAQVKRETFVHIHVPKTAGWMFMDILRQNFGIDFKQAYSPSSYEYISKKGVEWCLRHYRYRCYTSHNWRLSSLPALKQHRIVAISFVRDPVERCLSGYFYGRNISETGAWNPVKQLILTEYLEESLYGEEFKRIPYDVPQEEFIRGDWAPMPFQQFLHPDFGIYHLFPTERFDDAMLCLEALYPNDFKDCSYGSRSNVSKRDQKVTDKDLELIEQLPGIKKDRELCTFATEYLDNLLTEIFGSGDRLEIARANFKYRCEQKRNLAKDANNGRLSLTGRMKKAINILLRG